MVTSDKATRQDAIGFRLHAEVTAKVLWKQEQEDGKDRAKIAAAVEGDWGQGKSSYMRMMRHWLQKQGLRTAWVSVWHHKEDGTLWAETTRDILTQLRRDSNPLQATTAFFRRLGSLLVQYLKALGRSLPMILMIAFLALLLWLFIPENWWSQSRKVLERLPIEAGAVSISLILLVWKLVSDLYSHPLMSALQNAYRKRKGPAAGPTLSTFRHRLRQALHPYASRKKPVFVFIDDLDRIGPSEAAEVLWTLSQLFDERLPAVFVVGVDRDKVAAGLASKHDHVMPYMHAAFADRNTMDENEEPGPTIPTERRAVRFGYEFLEKVFNIRTEVPRLHLKQRQHFVDELIFPPEETNSKPNFGKRLKALFRSLGKPRVASSENKLQRSILASQDAIDLLKSHVFIDAVKDNPRRIKQVSNELHLWAEQLIAYEKQGYDVSTVSQWRLAKIILLRLQWPVFYADLEHHPKTLAPLALAAEYAMNEEAPTDWLSDAEQNCYQRCKDRLNDELINVLALGTERNPVTDVNKLSDRGGILNERSPDPYSLAGLDLDALLRVPHPAARKTKLTPATDALEKERKSPESSFERETGAAVVEEKGDTKTHAKESGAAGKHAPKEPNDAPTVPHAERPSQQEVRRRQEERKRIAKAAGKESADYAEALRQLGEAYLDDGKLGKARGALDQALKIADALVGKNDPLYGVVISSIGALENSKGNNFEAKRYFRQALDIFSIAYEEDHPNVAYAHGNLGLVMNRIGRFSDAEKHFDNALKILDSAHGSQHPAVATTLRNLGDVWQNLGEFGKARLYYWRARSIFELAYGKRHTDVALTKKSLADIMRIEGHLGEAKKELMQALNILKFVYGDQHPQLASTLNSLGNVLHEEGHLDEAKKLFENALNYVIDAYGIEHPSAASTLLCLGQVLRDQGQLDQARKTFEQALDIIENISGSQSFDLAFVLNGLGLVMSDQRSFERANIHFRKALEISETAYGNQHPNVAAILGNLGRLLHDKGQFECAEKYYDQAFKILRVTLGHKNSYLAIIKIQLGHLMLDKGEWEEARRLLEFARSTLQRNYGLGHWRVAQTNGWLSALEWEFGASASEAINSCGDALGRLLEVFGPLNYEYVLALSRKLQEMGGDPVAICWEALGENQAEELRALLDNRQST